MAENLTVARPYAEAAFSFAVDEKKLDEWQCMLQALSEAYKNDYFRDHLKLAANSSAAADSLISLLKPANLIDENGENFVKIIGENNRFEVLPDIYEEFIRLRQKHDKCISAQLISARAFAESEIKLIKDKLAKKYDCTVTIEQIIDKNLIGGAVLKVGDKVIDASVRTSLKNLSSTLR